MRGLGPAVDELTGRGDDRQRQGRRPRNSLRRDLRRQRENGRRAARLAAVRAHQQPDTDRRRLEPGGRLSRRPGQAALDHRRGGFPLDGGTSRAASRPSTRTGRSVSSSRRNAPSTRGEPDRTTTRTPSSRRRQLATSQATGQLDIVFGSYDHYIYALQPNGHLVPGFPINRADTIWSSPTLVDTSHTGRDDIIMGGDASGFDGCRGGWLVDYRYLRSAPRGSSGSGASARRSGRARPSGSSTTPAGRPSSSGPAITPGTTAPPQTRSSPCTPTTGATCPVGPSRPPARPSARRPSGASTASRPSWRRHAPSCIGRPGRRERLERLGPPDLVQGLRRPQRSHLVAGARRHHGRPRRRRRRAHRSGLGALPALGPKRKLPLQHRSVGVDARQWAATRRAARLSPTCQVPRKTGWMLYFACGGPTVPATLVRLPVPGRARRRQSAGLAGMAGERRPHRDRRPDQRVSRTSCGPISRHLVGYRLVTSDGAVFERGNLPYCGGLNTSVLPSTVVSMASTPDGRGYWLLLADGSVYAFGDATWYGDLRGSTWRGGPVPPGAPVVAHRRYPGWEGLLRPRRSTAPSTPSETPHTTVRGARKWTDGAVVGIAVDSATGGYWLVTSQRCRLWRGRPRPTARLQAPAYLTDRRYCGGARRGRLLARRPRRARSTPTGRPRTARLLPGAWLAGHRHRRQPVG